MNVLIGVAIALVVLVTLGVILWNRPQEEATELSPEREGTSYEEPQDEGAAELDGEEPVQGDGGEARPDPPDPPDRPDPPDPPDRPGRQGKGIDEAGEGRPD